MKTTIRLSLSLSVLAAPAPASAGHQTEGQAVAYPLKTINMDVPAREHAGGEGTLWFEGVFTVTAVDEEHASGYLQGRGGGPLSSFVTTELLDLDYSVEAMAFHDFPLL